MNILTLDNDVKSLDNIFNNDSEMVDFWYLHYSDKENTDFYTQPLQFAETFNDVCIVLDVAGRTVQLPMEWSIIIADSEQGTCEVLQPKMPGFSEKNFRALSFNPNTSFMFDFLPIRVQYALPDVMWMVPKLRFGHFLCMPIEEKENPKCVYITHRKNCKIPDVLNINYIMS